MNLLIRWAVPSSQMYLFCHVHYKNKTIYGLFKVPSYKAVFFLNWPERLNFIHGKKWAELVTEYWQMTNNKDNNNNTNPII